MKFEGMVPALKARAGETLSRQRVRNAQDGPQVPGAAMTCRCALERVTRERRAGSGSSGKTEPDRLLAADRSRLFLAGLYRFPGPGGVPWL